jgi:hypothetical protein
LQSLELRSWRPTVCCPLAPRPTGTRSARGRRPGDAKP